MNSSKYHSEFVIGNAINDYIKLVRKFYNKIVTKQTKDAVKICDEKNKILVKGYLRKDNIWILEVHNNSFPVMKQYSEESKLPFPYWG